MSFIAAFPGVIYFLGSLASGFSIKYFFTASENGIFKSVATFTLHIPKEIAFFTNSSGTSDAPCSTKGTSTASLISFNLSKSSFGSPFYKPCAVPIATAKESIPVFSTKSLACSGLVYIASFSFTTKSSSCPPNLPSSASTVASYL